MDWAAIADSMPDGYSISNDRTRLTWQGTLEMPEQGPESDSAARLLRKSYAKMFLGISNVVES